MNKIQPDKIKHFFLCFFISFVTTTYLRSVGIRFWPSVGWGTLAGTAAGFGKEFYDMKQPGNCFDWMDILADFLGILAGEILSWMIRGWTILPGVGM